MHAAAYQLEYMHQVAPSSVRLCYERRSVWVVMYRYAADRRLGETEDSFGVHCAETDKLIGACEDTKKDAEFTARYELMKRSEREFDAIHNAA